MQLRIEFSAEAERDFELIFDHLFESYFGIGENVETAIDHCEARIRDVRQEADRLGEVHIGGESHDDLLPSMRHLTIDRAVYCFAVNGAEQQVCVLAIFFNGQGHVRQMLTQFVPP